MSFDIKNALERLLEFTNGAVIASGNLAFETISSRLSEILSKLGKQPEIADNKTDILDLEIDELIFSARTISCLSAEKIKTIRDLISFSKIDLLRTPNFGKKSLKEVEDFLHSKGLFLKPLGHK